MNLRRAITWWPLVAVVAMGALGVAVGSGRTPLDSWFSSMGHRHLYLWLLLVFTEWRLLLIVLVVLLVVTLRRRRWRLATAVVVAPLAAIAAARLLKIFFGREKHGALAYPSGHTTTLVVVLGLIVMVAGVTALTVAAACVAALLGALGQGFTYHYFTDTIGGVLLGSALVCLTALATRVDTCQPAARSASQ